MKKYKGLREHEQLFGITWTWKYIKYLINMKKYKVLRELKQLFITVCVQ